MCSLQSEMLHIEPSAQALFLGSGPLATGAVWQSPTDTAQRIEERPSDVYYLKRGSALAPRHLLRPLLFGHWPRSGPLRELEMLQQLRSNRFPTMEPVAWGERRVLGIPRQGFLLVKAVEGEEVSALISTLHDTALEKLCGAIGLLFAELHLAGFFQPVRLKDLIKTDAGLVLIDRETSKPWKSLFTKRRCINSLGRSISRSGGCHCRLWADCCENFWTSYVEALHSIWKIAPLELYSRVKWIDPD